MISAHFLLFSFRSLDLIHHQHILLLEVDEIHILLLLYQEQSQVGAVEAHQILVELDCGTRSASGRLAVSSTPSTSTFSSKEPSRLGEVRRLMSLATKLPPSVF